MKPVIDIRPEHLEIVKNILKKQLPSHATVWAFGSLTKGTAKKFSDLDLVIDAGDPLPSSIMTNLAFDFEESDLPYKVDIVDWATINDSFRKIIEKDRMLINR